MLHMKTTMSVKLKQLQHVKLSAELLLRLKGPREFNTPAREMTEYLCKTQVSQLDVHRVK